MNTTKKERDPSVSGDYLAFVRGPGNLMLYQFSTGTLVRLVAGGVYHPQVNGDYVGFGRCIGTTVASCKVVDRYRISTMKTKKMPAPGIGRANYYGAVATDGTMYWVEGSTKICGKKVKIRRWQSGVVSTVWGAPPGVEAAYLQADVLGTTPTLAFARYVCSSKNFGAYKLSV